MNVRRVNPVEKLRRQFRNALKRAVYWSGRPGPPGSGFRPGTNSRVQSPDLEYEQAMDDLESLADAIAEATGERPVVRDVREEYRTKYAKVNWAAAVSGSVPK